MFPQQTTAGHRTDIDGLRAVAIISVVGYHYFPHVVRGGLVGVDVFFVISGFLISGILVRSLDAGRFSLLDFYRRRVLRIAPALVATLIGVLLIGWLCLFPAEYKLLGRHVTRAAFFVLNFNLLSEVGYFDRAAITKPLLHLWSLSIEEQFYLLWPLLLWVLWRWRGWAPLAGLVAILVVSFAINVALVQHDNTAAAFYLPQARFWELAAGAIAALILHRRGIPGPAGLARWLPLAGLVLVGVTPFLQMAPHFPGWRAAIPVLGSTLIVMFGGRPDWPGRSILSNRVAVAIGLISYPLYLWHWPLLSFAAIGADGSLPGLPMRLLLLAAALLLATLTFLFIEKPIRFGRFRRQAAIPLLASVLAMAAGGYAVTAQQGMPWRVTVRYAAGGGGLADLNGRYFPCEPRALHDSALKFQSITRCFQSKREAPTIAIIGDSHAEHLFSGLAEDLKDRSIVYYITDSLPARSDANFAGILDSVLDNAGLTDVIVSAFWSERLFSRSPEMDRSAFVDDLAATLRALSVAGKHVLVTNDVPDYPFLPESCLYTGLPLRQPRDCRLPLATWDGSLAKVNAMLAAVGAEAPGAAVYIDTFHRLCDAQSCSMVKDGTILYSDKNHLNGAGSLIVAKTLAAAVSRAAQ